MDAVTQGVPIPLPNRHKFTIKISVKIDVIHPYRIIEHKITYRI